MSLSCSGLFKTAPENQVQILKESFEVVRVKCPHLSKMVEGLLINHVSESPCKDRTSTHKLGLCSGYYK